MADKKKMSVADILAACRRLDSPEGEAAAAPPPAAEPPASEPAAQAPPPAADKPTPAAAPKPTPKAGGGRPSVQEMLAMARGEKAAPKPAAAKPAAPAPARPAAPTAKKTPAAPAPAKPSGPKDTASVLAAARAAKKPGPISKAEAASSRAHSEVTRAVKERIVVPPMPIKPAYARPKPPAPAPVDEGRRRFEIVGVLFGSFLALGFTAMAATFGMWSLGLARFMFPNILREPPSQFKVGFPSSFPPGVVETKFIPQYGVWVVNTEYNGQPQIAALKAVCTHLGCTPNWLEAEQKFKCPCHGSGFYKDGINFEGPAPRPLERYAIRIADDGQLEIDKSRTFQQEMGGWDDAASFVAV